MSNKTTFDFKRVLVFNACMDKHNTDKTTSESGSDDPPDSINNEDNERALAVVWDIGEGESAETKWLEENMERVIDALGLVRLSLTVVLIDDERMCEMHERYAGVGGTTDVLSFDLRDDRLTEVSAEVV